MFVRYLGGGVGHLKQFPPQTATTKTQLRTTTTPSKSNQMNLSRVGTLPSTTAAMKGTKARKIMKVRKMIETTMRVKGMKTMKRTEGMKRMKMKRTKGSRMRQMMS